MYFALTGQPPFPGGDAKSKIRRHRKEVPPPLQELNPLIPADFAAVVHPLLAKRPEDRPASAAVLRQQLMKWADPLPYAAPAVPEKEADSGEVIADLEAEQEAAGGAGSAWDWVPPVSLAETAGGPTWWARLSRMAWAVVVAAIGLAAVAVGVAAWWLRRR
jgi:hypothetical protein